MTSTSRALPTFPIALAVGAVGAVLGLLLLGGCADNGPQATHSSGADPSLQQPSPSGPSPSTSPSSPSSPSGPSASPSTNPSTTGSSAVAATGGSCALRDLAVGTRAPAGGAAAGSSYVLLTFRNVSGATCVLDGHPGVSFVGKGNGTQLGDPAVHRTSAVVRVRLRPGATTTALLQIANAADYDATTCAPTTADGFRVYPPDSRTSTFVPFATQACQRSLPQSPQLSVSAVGRAS